MIKYYNLEYAMWALLVGMIICNTVGVPKWLEPAVQGEIFIKIGLVLLGAEVLFTQLLALGVPGVFCSWLVTPTVLIGTYIFGQKFLKMESRSLNIVISADMSVCGVSAAIATAAACKAKKEELSLAIGLSLCFTAIMMVVMPRIIVATGMDPIIGGAWIGGTIDSTGAVAAAGEALGIRGFETAVTVKMIQNILIGVVALCVAIYWTRWVEPAEQRSAASQDSASGKESELAMPATKIGLGEIWKRFPKFVLGFIAASVIFSLIFSHSFYGASWVQATTKDYTALVRGWMFCLAFVSIGLTTNFKEMAPYLMAGKPMILYLCGQALNLILTLVMAYLMFGIIFKA
ncbi:MAG: putative sulfate exporter family transporter [Pirellulales bacterium]